jgi:hypothetical protein
MSHFHITLPSDSSANYYPDNTITSFVTKLPERIGLEGEYEVSSAEIIYPHTLYNVDNGDEKYWIATVGVGRNRMQTVYLPSRYYESGSDIAAVLNREFSLSSSSRFADLRNVRRPIALHGFRPEHYFSRPGAFGTMAQQAFDVNRRLNLLYVYCDVATHTIVGDTKTPLLRTCNVTGKHGEFVRHTYVQTHYVPVGRREFDSVEIAINNELVRSMPFEYGKSVVILHFRRKRASM